MTTQVPPPPAPRAAAPQHSGQAATKLTAPSATLTPAAAIAARSQRTPSRTSTLLRTALVASLAALAIAGAISWFLTNQLADDTQRIETSTGEVLIGNQSILASLAEADAAAAAVHLAGADGDRVQRSTYEQALERAGVGLERIARVLGDDEPSHEALQQINTSLTSYAGLVEAARARSIENIQPEANDQLSDAIQLLREEISPNVELVSQRADERFASDSASTWYLIAPLVLLLPIIVLLVVQRWMSGRFRRLLNPPLVLATIILIALAAWLALGGFVQQDALQDARDGAYRSIDKTAELQSRAFQYRADDAERVIKETPKALAADGIVVEGLIDELNLLADSPREQAAAAEVQVRWAEYVQASERVTDAVSAGDFDQARELIRGESNTAFTGFNTSVEGALFDNRAQFDDAVDDASAALRWLTWAIPIGVLLAALLTWIGISLRMREYR